MTEKVFVTVNEKLQDDYNRSKSIFRKAKLDMVSFVSKQYGLNETDTLYLLECFNFDLEKSLMFAKILKIFPGRKIIMKKLKHLFYIDKS